MMMIVYTSCCHINRPPYILQPQAWSKVLPPPFLVAKEEALRRARLVEMRNGIITDGDDDTHPYDDNDESILMVNQQQQPHNFHQHHERQISYDAGDLPLYDDDVVGGDHDVDRTDEPFDQHIHHPPDSYRSFEPPLPVKYDPYDRFGMPTTTAVPRRTNHHYLQQQYEPSPPPPSSSSRHGGGRMEPPDGNDYEEDPVVFQRQQQHQQQRHLPHQQQQPNRHPSPAAHQIPHSSYAPPPPPLASSSSQYSDYHHPNDYRRPDPMVLHISGGMDPPEDEPPSLRKPSTSQSSSRYNVGEPPLHHHPRQQHSSVEENSDDQYTEPFAEPHDSYEPVDEYYDNEGRMDYADYEGRLEFADDSPVTAQSMSDYNHYRQHQHPVVITSPTASDGDFTDPTIGTFSPRRSGLPPTSPARSHYSQNSALASEVLRSSGRTKQQLGGGQVYHNNHHPDALTPLSQPSASTWETDGTSEYSSVWTENEPDRTSRRALILQMAKARMKNNNTTSTTGSMTGSGADIGGKSSSSHYQHHHHQDVEDEKKLGDIDLRGELD
jgi:hypothetical protein